MDLNLRAAIINNMSNNDESQIEATILDAIQSGEEKMLPGLGVLFELMWQHAPEDEKNQALAYIKQGLQE